MQFKTIRNLSLGLVAGLAITGAVSCTTDAQANDPFDQKSFVCQEDELLGFSESDPNRLECFSPIHFWFESWEFVENYYPVRVYGVFPNGDFAYVNSLFCADPGELEEDQYNLLIDSPACRDGAYYITPQGKVAS